MTLEQAASTGAILLLAYFIRGISGFGSGLIAVPLLAHFLPLTFVVPLLLLLDFSASLLLGGATWRQADWREVAWLLPFTLVGVGLGAFLLINLPATPLLLTLGLFVAAFGLRSLLGLQGEQRIGRWWAAPAGLTGGAVGAMFGTGGPPYVIYLSHRLGDKSALRATFSGLFLIDGGLRILLFAVAGLLHSQLLLAALVAAPVLAAGLWLGHRVHIGIGQAQLQRLIGAILLLSGFSLLTKALI